MALITRSEIISKRAISKSTKEAVINQFIDDAELLDLLPILGEQFYFSIVSDPGSFSDLLNEKKYTYNNVEITSPGLKRVLIDLFYARYILHGTQTDTPFGFVEKTYQDAKPVERINRKEIYKLSQQTAMQYWSQVEKYLQRHSDTYPLWNVGCGVRKRTFRLNKITR